jgi:hypothetical protein
MINGRFPRQRLASDSLRSLLSVLPSQASLGQKGEAVLITATIILQFPRFNKAPAQIHRNFTFAGTPCFRICSVIKSVPDFP